jgi:uncharacterized protein (DUF362 family)
MSEHSRRDFIVRSAAAGISTLGAGKLLLPEAHAAEKAADMAIARWTGPKDTAEQIQQAAVQLTEKALEGIGGLKRFISRGDVVWVKPNIAWDRTPELAGNTNPDVVATLVRMCLEAGAKTVKVGDHPCNEAKLTYKSTGIAAAAEKAGAEVLFLDTSRFREMSVKGERFESFQLCPEILESDVIVNVPIVKHHGMATATLCMKNLMGLMDGSRSRYHQALADMLADLTRFVKPQVSIMDAVRILTAHGPRGGNPEDVQMKMTVAAGVDIVALDAFGAELLGRKPTEIGTIVKGQEAGLGTMDYRSLALREIAVS